MCEKNNTCTKEHFEEIFGSDEDAYYVYYIDDDGVMHFTADSYDVNEGAFTTDFYNASMFSKSGAKFALLLGAKLLDYDLHVVHIKTKVVWDC